MIYNSCGDRHCPTCGCAKRADWVESAGELILDGVDYFHVVFTRWFLAADRLLTVAVGESVSQRAGDPTSVGRYLVDADERRRCYREYFADCRVHTSLVVARVAQRDTPRHVASAVGATRVARLILSGAPGNST